MAAKKFSKRKKVRNPDLTRTNLLQATIALLAKKGVDALSLKEVAKLAQVSRAVAYLHFKDRSHLLREASSSISDQLASLFAYRSSSSLRQQLRGAATLIMTNPDIAKLLVIDCLNDKELPATRALFSQITTALEQFNRSGQARKNLDVEMLSFILLGAFPAVVMLATYGRSGCREELAMRLTREWMATLRGGIFARTSRRRNVRSLQCRSGPLHQRR